MTMLAYLEGSNQPSAINQDLLIDSTGTIFNYSHLAGGYSPIAHISDFGINDIDQLHGLEGFEELETEELGFKFKMPKMKMPKMPKFKAPKMPKMKAPKMPKMKAPKMPKMKAPKMPKINTKGITKSFSNATKGLSKSVSNASKGLSKSVNQAVKSHSKFVKNIAKDAGKAVKGIAKGAGDLLETLLQPPPTMEDVTENTEDETIDETENIEDETLEETESIEDEIPQETESIEDEFFDEINQVDSGKGVIMIKPSNEEETQMEDSEFLEDNTVGCKIDNDGTIYKYSPINQGYVELSGHELGFLSNIMNLASGSGKSGGGLLSMATGALDMVVPGAGTVANMGIGAAQKQKAQIQAKNAAKKKQQQALLQHLINDKKSKQPQIKISAPTKKKVITKPIIKQQTTIKPKVAIKPAQNFSSQSPTKKIVSTSTTSPTFQTEINRNLQTYQSQTSVPNAETPKKDNTIIYAIAGAGLLLLFVSSNKKSEKD